MWCYQKPGFEALLLAELQRQQQCSQFCDTLLKADGVSVPAHSCVLSAISPHFFSALSSSPAPPAGQGRLLECQTLGTCTLLHMVRLLYSGEMAGEGEKEKQEAVSAAAKLGIHGLVEVTTKDCERRNGEVDFQRTEMGVQTEELLPEECGVTWRREVRDGSMFLWKEMLSNGKKDSWTQTEELQVNAAPSYQSYETIDLATLQSLGQTDSQLLSPQIPYTPISLVYPPEAIQTPQPSTAPAASFQESPPAGSLFSALMETTGWGADPQSQSAGPYEADGDVTVEEKLGEKQLEQFQGNIPDFINYFLNTDKVERPRRGRPRRRQGAGTGERRARRPHGRRGRGGLTQRVDVQDVGVSGLQKLFLLRCSLKACRPGQGGGAAGRKLHLKTRELLKKTAGCQRRRGGRKLWDFGQSAEIPPFVENTPCKSRTTTQETKQAKNHVSSRQRARSQPEKSVSCYNVHTLAGPSLQPPSLTSPAASYAFPALSTPYENQPEHFDRLLEEVIMGLDCSSSVNAFSQNKQQSQASGPPDAGPRCHGSADGRSSSATGEAPVLQQKAEGELTDMLDNFLRSFEQHVESCTSREEDEVAGEGSAEVRKHSRTRAPRTRAQAARRLGETTQSRPKPHKPPSTKHTEGTPGRVTDKRTKRRKAKQYLLPLEKSRVRQRSGAKTKLVPDHGDKQLQQMPVVQLERGGPLPANVTLQRRSCQCLEVKSLAQTKNCSSSSVNTARVGLSERNQLFSWTQMAYPIRSGFKEAHIDSGPFLEQPLPRKQARRPGRPRKNRELNILSKEESSETAIQLQLLEACGKDEQPESREHQEEGELTVLPQEESTGGAGRGAKRRSEELSNDTKVAKRVCFPRSESTDLVSENEDMIDVETISLTSVEDTLQKKEEESPAWSEGKLGATDQNGEDRESLTDEEMVSSGDEIIDVDGISDGSVVLEREDDKLRRRHRTLLKDRSTGSRNEERDSDVDVVGGSSPLPEQVIISSTEAPAGEE